jgi:hypothetical protein
VIWKCSRLLKQVGFLVAGTIKMDCCSMQGKPLVMEKDLLLKESCFLETPKKCSGY